MKMVFIYGPPGVGKLTVAMELSKLTGYKVYHNHLAIEAIIPIFDFGTKEYNDLIAKYRMQMLHAIVRSKLQGVIITFVYAPGIDDKYIKILLRDVKAHKGKAFFVRLYCEKSELFKRVHGKSRRHYNKITKNSELQDLLDRYSYITLPMNGHKSLSIDNTNIKPKEAALMIKSRLKL